MRKRIFPLNVNLGHDKSGLGNCAKYPRQSVAFSTKYPQQLGTCYPPVRQHDCLAFIKRPFLRGIAVQYRMFQRAVTIYVKRHFLLLFDPVPINISPINIWILKVLFAFTEHKVLRATTEKKGRCNKWIFNVHISMCGTVEKLKFLPAIGADNIDGGTNFYWLKLFLFRCNVPQLNISISHRRVWTCVENCLNSWIVFCVCRANYCEAFVMAWPTKSIRGSHEAHSPGWQVKLSHLSRYL